MHKVIQLYIYIYIYIYSEGREIKLLIGYLKRTVCIACRSYYKEVFFHLEEIFSQILEPAKAKVASP